MTVVPLDGKREGAVDGRPMSAAADAGVGLPVTPPMAFCESEEP